MIGKIKQENYNFLLFFISISILISTYYSKNYIYFLIYIFSFFSSFLSTKRGIKLIKKYKLFQKIREDGPVIHKLKSNTPTFGGLFFIPIFLIIILLINIPIYPIKILLLFTSAGYFLVGLLDDYLSVKNNKNIGLKSHEKFLLQTGISTTFVLLANHNNLISSEILFLKDIEINISLLTLPLFVLLIVGFSNAVNLTDGLDGLAAGCSAIVFCGLGTEIIINNDPSQYAYIILCYSLSGLCLGFLKLNKNPAKIFMGDTGSLCLGAILGTICILSNNFLSVVIFSGVFIIETLSVIIQVAFFKVTKRLFKTGQRLLLMSPLHHHFEMKGLDEKKIVESFWKLNIFFVILGIVLKKSF